MKNGNTKLELCSFEDSKASKGGAISSQELFITAMQCVFKNNQASGPVVCHYVSS